VVLAGLIPLEDRVSSFESRRFESHPATNRGGDSPNLRFTSLCGWRLLVEIFVNIHLAKLALPLPALLAGVWISHLAGIPVMAFATNFAGLAIGILLALSFRRVSDAGLTWAAIVALVVLAATFAFAGIDGVHRWIRIGPIGLNASMAFAPILLAAVALRGRSGMIVFLGATVLHLLQPDAGQGTATALACGFLFLKTETGLRRLTLLAIAVAGAVATWFRPDPLGAVPQVERILHLAAAQGMFANMTALVSSLLLLVPFVMAQIKSRDILAGAFVLYFVAQFVVTELGNFPVPVIGAGAAGVIGWYVALGLSERRTAAP